MYEKFSNYLKSVMNRSVLSFLVAISLISLHCGDDQDDSVYKPVEEPEVYEVSKTLTLSASISVEPYIFKESDSGFEVDIVREVFELSGYKVRFVYQPLKRSKVSFMEGLVDGVMTIKKEYPEIKGAFLSDNYITYHNYAVTLTSKNFMIKGIADLSDKSIISFQQASAALGKEFEKMSKMNSKYSEMANQGNQISMLFINHTDVIVLDFLIFEYYKNRLKDISADKPVTLHKIFKPSEFCMAFRDKKIRDIFNSGLKKMKRSGRYKKIIGSYIYTKNEI